MRLGGRLIKAISIVHEQIIRHGNAEKKLQQNNGRL